MKHLVETALLTHGLKSITNEEIRDVWTSTRSNIAWISKGKIVIGTMEEYLEFRKEAASLIRIDCDILEDALKDGKSGALTASGTMAVCRKLDIPLAVTCGMGGIGDIIGEELCPDLPALVDIPAILISTGPKDMLERRKTIEWLTGHGVRVIGAGREYCTGYIFTGEAVPLQGICGQREKEYHSPLLIINEIPEEKRIRDRGILEEAILEGKRAEKEGRYYHPAVNGKIGELTEGYSSRIQLLSLMANAELAEQM